MHRCARGATASVAGERGTARRSPSPANTSSAPRRRSTRAARAGALLVLTLAGGCSLTPEPVPVDDPQAVWSERRSALERIIGWRLTGRIGVVTEDEGGSAILRWREAHGAYQIDLLGPFGRGLARLQGTAYGAVLQTSEGAALSGPDAETLFAARLGWRVPVDPLRRWILGLSGDGDDYRLDARGRLASVVHGDWEVRFLSYREVDGVELPDKLYLRGTGLGIRLAVHEWSIET